MPDFGIVIITVAWNAIVKEKKRFPMHITVNCLHTILFALILKHISFQPFQEIENNCSQATALFSLYRNLSILQRMDHLNDIVQETSLNSPRGNTFHRDLRNHDDLCNGRELHGKVISSIPVSYCQIVTIPTVSPSTSEQLRPGNADIQLAFIRLNN